MSAAPASAQGPHILPRRVMCTVFFCMAAFMYEEQRLAAGAINRAMFLHCWLSWSSNHMCVYRLH